MRNIFCKTCNRTRTIAFYVLTGALASFGVDQATGSILSRAILSLLGGTS